MNYASKCIRNTLKGIALLSLSLSVILLAIQPSSARDLPPVGKKKIIYGNPGAGSALIFITTATILLEKIGYEVDSKKMGTGLIYQGLATGDVDLMSTAFLPGQHPHVNKHEDKLDFIGTSYAPVPSGLLAPAYVPFNSIADLKKPEVQKSLKGIIHSGGPGWGVSIRANETIKAYGLDFKVVNSSGAAMNAAFKKAYAKKKPVLITGWCPHFLCKLYDIKFLSDSKGIWGYSQDYHVARLGFRKDFPRATVLISRLTLDVSFMNQALAWMESEKIDAPTAAKRILEQNPELVWYWAGDLGGGIKKPDSLKK